VEQVLRTTRLNGGYLESTNNALISGEISRGHASAERSSRYCWLRCDDCSWPGLVWVVGVDRDHTGNSRLASWFMPPHSSSIHLAWWNGIVKRCFRWLDPLPSDLGERVALFATVDFSGHGILSTSMRLRVTNSGLPGDSSFALG